VALLRLLVLTLAILAAARPAAGDEVLLFDGFDGVALDPVAWLRPEGQGTFFGRTQIRAPWVPLVVAGGVLRLALDTHNPTALVPGDSFVDDAGRPLPSGIVGALFAFETDGIERDEIDVELLSRDLRQGLERCLTNVFEDDGFDQGGRKAFVDVEGLASGFHRYRIEWNRDRIRWLVDGRLVREVSEGVPDEPMDARLNVWVPDAEFAEAFDGALQPVAEARLNETFYVEVDEVLIVRLPEPRAELCGAAALLAAWLLVRRRAGARRSVSRR
jgi:hypothetical protein